MQFSDETGILGEGRRWSPGGRVDECVVWCWSNEPQSKSSKTKETVVDCLRSRPLRQPFPNDDDDDEEEAQAAAG